MWFYRPQSAVDIVAVSLQKPLGLEGVRYEYHQPENREPVYLVCSRRYFCVNHRYSRNIGIGRGHVTRLF